MYKYPVFSSSMSVACEECGVDQGHLSVCFVFIFCFEYKYLRICTKIQILVVIFEIYMFSYI